MSLREGFSTGTCAAGAAKAAALWLTGGTCPACVSVHSPQGREFHLAVVPGSEVGVCGVVKDAGDDIDATDGLTVFCSLEISGTPGGITFKAGEGVGTVTLPGLKVPVGDAAINPVPRRMIEDALRDVLGGRGACVTVSVPGGADIAVRTFNLRLGIEGGISILGTSGVVRPMHEESLLESLTLELKTHAGKEALALAFGNTGEEALRKAYSITGRCVVQVGNYVGHVLDEASKIGFKQLLLCGHPGKLLKVAAGSFNTHNRVADGRMEALCTHAALRGADISGLYRCNTTEEAMDMIERMGIRAVWTELAHTAARRCTARSFGGLQVEAAFIDNGGAVLGESGCAARLAEVLAHGRP